MSGWIGVDLDGTVAMYDIWRGPTHIGEPIMPMVNRIKAWLAEGKEVRIVTARYGGELDCNEVVSAIDAWCFQHIGRILPVTNKKDYAMIELWDDRAIQVIPNTGHTIADELESLKQAHAGKAAYDMER